MFSKGKTPPPGGPRMWPSCSVQCFSSWGVGCVSCVPHSRGTASACGRWESRCWPGSIPELRAEAQAHVGDLPGQRQCSVSRALSFCQLWGVKAGLWFVSGNHSLGHFLSPAWTVTFLLSTAKGGPTFEAGLLVLCARTPEGPRADEQQPLPGSTTAWSAKIKKWQF
jgi:hypothetical protein